MSEFLLNVLASVIGGIFLILAAGLISRRARWILTGLLARLLDVDIDYVFESKEVVKPDLKAELRRSRNVAILTGRGNEFQRDTFATLLP